MLRASNIDIGGRPVRRPANNYLAWRIVQEEAQHRDLREVPRRVILRSSLDYNDLTEFRCRYRLSTQAFRYLCRDSATKTTLRASKRISLDHKVLCALSFFVTGSYQRMVGMGKYLGQTTVSKFVGKVTDTLTHPDVVNGHIRFPTTVQERNQIKQKFYQKFGIPGILGCVDGFHFHIFRPSNAVEHLYYRKDFHSLNVQVVCDSDCKITSLNPKYGGTTHDSFVWNNSLVRTFMESLHRRREQGWLLGSTLPNSRARETSSDYLVQERATRLALVDRLNRLLN